MSVSAWERQKVSKNEWIIHEDAHDAIVSKELFYEVRSVVDQKGKEIFCGKRRFTADGRQV